MRIDLQYFCDFFSNNHEEYSQYYNYYRGSHELYFDRIKKYKNLDNLIRNIRANICKSVIDTTASRIQLAGFNTENEDALNFIKDYFKKKRITSISRSVIRDCLIMGDAYLGLWTDNNNDVNLFIKNPYQTTVHYDEYGKEDCALSYNFYTDLDNREWTDIFVYYSDRIYKSTVKGHGLPNFIETAEEFSNPFGIVPIFHFYNGIKNDEFCRSDLTEIIPLQRALNKCLQDRMQAEELMACKQRWATGVPLEETEDEKISFIDGGINKMVVSTSEETRFGEFTESPLDNYTGVIDSLHREVASVSRIPLHLLNLSSSNFPSGEALRLSESPLMAKIYDKQISIGDVFEDIFKVILTYKGFGDVEDLEAVWTDTTPYNESEKIQNAANKLALGIPEEIVFKEMGYNTETFGENNGDL